MKSGEPLMHHSSGRKQPQQQEASAGPAVGKRRE
jgi:hypothetical protein